MDISSGYKRYNSLSHYKVCGIHVNYDGVDLRKTGIYGIECLSLDKIYIGATRDKFRDRWGAHIKRLRDGKHGNKYLQEAWNKEGEVNFRFLILEFIDNNSELNVFNEREEFYLKLNNDRRFNFSDSYAATRGITIGEEQLSKLCMNWVIVSPDNEIYYVTNMKKFCRDHNLSQWSLHDVVSRKRKSYNGWLAYRQDNFNENMILKDRKLQEKRKIEFIDYDGNVYIVDNLTQFCKDNDCDLSNIYKHIRGSIKGKHYKWKSILYIDVDKMEDLTCGE